MEKLPAGNLTFLTLRETFLNIDKYHFSEYIIHHLKRDNSDNETQLLVKGKNRPRTLR